MKDKFRNRIIALSVILLLVYLVIRFIDQGKLLTQFPFDFTNDLSSHIAKIVFLSEYGFRQIVPYWYNGYELFKFYPPGWFYFTLPLYGLIQDAQVATYVSLILIYLLGVVFFIYLGRSQKFSWIESMFFFLVFFGSPIAIGNFIKVGRMPELFAWLMFIPYTGLILWFKDKKIDWKIILLILLYGIMLLSHQTTFIIASLLLLSLFLVKKKFFEKAYILLIVGVTAILTSFWWYPFLRDIGESSIIDPRFSSRLFLWRSLLAENILSILIPIVFLVLFYYYWRENNKSRKELIFFLPLLIIAVLYLSRAIIFVPLFNVLYPDIYHHFFLFFIAFFFLKTVYPENLRRLFYIAPLVVAVIMIISSVVITPWFVENSKLDRDVISLLPDVEGKFVMLGVTSSYGKAFYSYAPIYYNLSTPSGWSHNEKSSLYLKKIREMRISFQEEHCEDLKNVMEELNTTTIITSGDYCMEEYCGIKKTHDQGDVCLLTR